MNPLGLHSNGDFVSFPRGGRRTANVDVVIMRVLTELVNIHPDYCSRVMKTEMRTLLPALLWASLS